MGEIVNGGQLGFVSGDGERCRRPDRKNGAMMSRAKLPDMKIDNFVTVAFDDVPDFLW